MKASALNKRHPSCDAALFRQYNALYKGGAVFRKLITDFLPRNPMEGADVYELRKRSARYRGYLGPICDFFAALLFASPFVVRTTVGGVSAVPDLFYSQFREDVDLVGTDLAEFMKGRFLSALVRQTAWILAEMPDDEGVAPAGRAEWEARGLGRVRVCPLEADDVLDWECDPYGQLLWAITYKRETRRDDPRLERALVTETWRLYDTETVETFQVVYDPTKRKIRPDDEIPSIGRREHRFPRVPLVPLRLPDGLWLANRIADAQVQHFQLSAAMFWAITRTCYPQAIFKAEDKDSVPITGAGYVHRIGLNESIEWVSPGTAAFDVLTGEIAAQVHEIYRIAQQMASAINGSAAALDRSGDSKEADQEATKVCLHAYGRHVKATMEALFELISDGRGDVEVTFSMEGMDKFSLGDVTLSLANLTTAKALAIASKTLSAELGCKAADLLLPDASQTVKDLIREEIRTAAEEQAKAPPPPKGGPPAGDAGGAHDHEGEGEKPPPAAA